GLFYIVGPALTPVRFPSKRASGTICQSPTEERRKTTVLSAQEVQTIMYNGLPSAADTALQVEWVEGNRARVRYPFKPSMIRPGGTISGPTMMGLADSAMYAVILGRLGAL